MSRVFYNQADLKPHKSRYWLNAEPDARAHEKMADLTTLYAQAPDLLEAGERVLSTDAMTGIQRWSAHIPPGSWHRAKRSGASANISGVARCH
jgi:hypothetical protein